MTMNTQEAVLDAWNDIDSVRRREILAIPLIAFSLISILALFSYTPVDLAPVYPHESDTQQSIQNWIGIPGAKLAWVIINLFGASGYCLPALFFFWGIDRLRPGSDASLRKIRIAGCALLLISLSSFLGLLTTLTSEIPDTERMWQVCGAIGYTLCQRLLQLGPAGALIINTALIALALVLCTPFLFTDFFRRIALFFFPEPSEEEEMEIEEAEYTESDNTDEIFDKSNLWRNSGDTLTLAPLNTAEDIKWEPEISTPGFEDDDTLVLPPITIDAEEFEEDGIRIITNEEEPAEEIDLGVNLIKTLSDTEYQLPPISMLEKPDQTRPEIAREEIIQNSHILEQTLSDFNISSKVVEVNYGPTITCYELEPAPGIKISRIENLANDITRSLKACTVRIVAPIPGKGTVGVEVPNRHRSDVFLRELITCDAYQSTQSKLKFGLGKTISGEPFIFDLIKAPHLLVAGATGSGKSVCINTIITSFLYNAAPHELKLLLVDPKHVELALYKDIPHLLSPVVTDPQKAGAALRWAVEEMENRYRYLKKAGVRNIKEFNKKRMAQQEGKISETESSLVLPGFLPYIVIIIDELADLMMVVRGEVEASIARLAAMARAVGIHLVLATQRPSVDVLTGVIKNNFPSRIAFQVSSSADSRTILDMKGADSLLGRGDMLFSTGGAGKPIRVQGSFISTEEVEEVANFVKTQQEVEYVQEEFIPLDESSSLVDSISGDSEEDRMYREAMQIVLENDSASTSLLQRRLKIGYGRAARLLDLMEENGVVGPPRGSKPREIILNNNL